MYKCERCGETMSFPGDTCPHCGAIFSRRITCKNCSYSSAKSEFVYNDNCCPKCGIDVDDEDRMNKVRGYIAISCAILGAIFGFYTGMDLRLGINDVIWLVFYCAFLFTIGGIIFVCRFPNSIANVIEKIINKKL